MNLTSKDDFKKHLIQVASNTNIYQQIEGLVTLTQLAHKNGWNQEKNDTFKNLIQVFLTYLYQSANQFYRFDSLIDKSKTKILWSPYGEPKLPEHLICVIGLFWELIMKYDPMRGVYFVHYLQKHFDWYFKKLSRTRLRKKKYRDQPHEDYGLVSYEEITEQRDETGNYSYGATKIGDLNYDDNFDLVTLDWSLKEPKEFVDDYDLFIATSSFTEKQTEVFVLELEGYLQEQIAGEVRKSGLQISQQGVSERLSGVKRKIEKIQIKRGITYEQEKSSNPA
ncbi:hypothetical protein MKX68_28630 [Paenibacillus sp. FSL M8-0212]|uniref:hypothetical protein n=1 Tax=Paenibacillus sp. FSL M8-0212 TaxID=2921618 RepID=UPI0030FD076C